VLIAGGIDDVDLALAGNPRNRKKFFCRATLFNFLQRKLSAFRTKFVDQYRAYELDALPKF
jgi:hypothetical protein